MLCKMLCESHIFMPFYELAMLNPANTQKKKKINSKTTCTQYSCYDIRVSVTVILAVFTVIKSNL